MTPGAVFAVLMPLRRTGGGWLLRVQQVLRGDYAAPTVELAFDRVPAADQPLVVVFTLEEKVRFPDADRRVAVPPTVVRTFLAGESVYPDTAEARALLLQGSDDATALLALLTADAPVGRLAAAELVGHRLLSRLDDESLARVARFVTDETADPWARELLLQFGMEQAWALTAARALLDVARPRAAPGGDALLHTALDVVGRHGGDEDLDRLLRWQRHDNGALAEAAATAHHRLVHRPVVDGGAP